VTEDDFGQADVDRFWRTVDAAGRDRERLRAALMLMTKDEIDQFQDIFVEMAVELRGEPYTFHVAPGESEDGLEDISNWVVSQGREQYEAVLGDPGLMPAEVDVDDPTILFPVAFDVHWQRFGEELDVT
jgi:hypothetical protein